MGKISDGSVSTRNYLRQYDARNRLKLATDYKGKTVKFDYDKANNVTQVTDAATKRTGYLYDEQNRVKSVTTNDGESIVYDWYADGLLKNVNYKNGLKREYSYDNADRVSLIKNTVGVNSQGTQTQEFIYGYDPNSNRLSETRKTDGNERRKLVYAYDELNRLTLSTETTPAPATQPAPGQSITVTENSLLSGNGYDPVGNRDEITTQSKVKTITRTANAEGQVSETSTEQAGQVSTATAQFDALNRLTNLSENNVNTLFAYDNNGNLLSETIAGAVQKRYEYDTRDQLKKVFAGAANEIAKFDYDYGRRRTSKQTANTSLHYVYAGDAVINEFDSSSGLLPLANRYELGAGEVVKAELRNENTNYYFSDALGSTTNLSQTSGTQSASSSTAEYDSFGKLNQQTGASANSIGYTGQRLDTETGLMALGNGERYYSPALARFTQQDSFGGLPQAPQSLNRYAYTINNPLIHTDPSGHIAPLVVLGVILGAMAIGAVAGAAYSGIKQNAEIADGTRPTNGFSYTEMAQTAGSGALLAIPFAAAMIAGPISAAVAVGGGAVLSAIQIYGGVQERNAGRKNSGNVDIAFGALGLLFSAKGARSLQRNGATPEAAPRVLEENPVLAETQNAPLRLSDGGVQNRISTGKLLSVAPDEVVNPPRPTRFYGDENGGAYDSQSSGKTPWQAVEGLAGHGHARHGSQTQGVPQIARLLTKVAPDGKTAPTSRATAFDSVIAELDAVKRAEMKIGEMEAKGLVSRAIKVDALGNATLPNEVVQTVVTGRKGGYGSGYEVPNDPATGKPYPSSLRMMRPYQRTGQDPNATLPMKYNIARGKWEPLTHFPTNDPPTP